MDKIFDEKKLKELRQQNGLTQRKLAEMAGISNAYLSMIETGRINPSLKTLFNFVKLLEVDVKTLIIDDDDNNK